MRFCVEIFCFDIGSKELEQFSYTMTREEKKEGFHRRIKTHDLSLRGKREEFNSLLVYFTHIMWGTTGYGGAARSFHAHLVLYDHRAVAKNMALHALLRAFLF